MCFYGESEWTASVQEFSEPIADKPVKCDECRVVIPVGTKFTHLHQQEHEECDRCENGDCDCCHAEDDDAEPECCKCEKPDFGEDFDWDCCDECWKFLEAIQAAEIEEGCSRSESRPSLTDMVESLQDLGREETEKYFVMANKMFPELETSGYLARMKKQLRWEDD